MKSALLTLKTYGKLKYFMLRPAIQELIAAYISCF